MVWPPQNIILADFAKTGVVTASEYWIRSRENREVVNDDS
jgi:hypothetical protein